jgi:hypothetical protein
MAANRNATHRDTNDKINNPGIYTTNTKQTEEYIIIIIIIIMHSVYYLSHVAGAVDSVTK